MQVKAILTKPLDSFPEGAKREFDQPDFDRLEAMGAVRATTAEEDADDDETTAETVTGAPVVKEPADQAEEKAAPRPANKRAPPVLNKAAD